MSNKQSVLFCSDKAVVRHVPFVRRCLPMFQRSSPPKLLSRVSENCCVALPHVATGLATVCDCDISLSILFLAGMIPIWIWSINVQMVPVNTIA